jgi:hypothetical protein
MKIVFYVLAQFTFLFWASCAVASDLPDNSLFQVTSLDEDRLPQTEKLAQIKIIALEQNRKEVEPAPNPKIPLGLPNEQINPQPPVVEPAPIDPIPPPVAAPVQAPSVPTDPRYLIVPRTLAPGQVDPRGTSVPISGLETTHLSDYEVSTSLRLGSSRSTNIGLNAIKFFAPYTGESASNQWIYRTEYSNNYVQAQTLRKNRDISIFFTFDQTDQREDQSFDPSVGIGRVRQVFVSNGERSGIGRTIRGFNYSSGDRNLALNSGVQLLTEALPNAEPQLNPGKPGTPFFINSNLVQAANNLRLPENSFTAYNSGQGYALNPADLKAISPPANYNALWVGLSPILDRSVTQALTATNLAVRLGETTDYYPHVSLSGNTTAENSVFRYYTGAIFNTGFTPHRVKDTNNIKAYGGLDFSGAGKNGLGYNLGLIGYINSDPDNYSRLSANVSQRINISSNPAYNLSLAAGFNYALDGANEFDNLVFQPGNSFLNTSATLNLGNIALGTTYYFSNSLPNPIRNLLSTNIAWQIQNNIAVSGYYTPINDNSSRSPYGANASFKLGTEPSSPNLVLSWSRNETDFGGGRNVNNDLFGIFFRFGESINPMSK